MVVFCSSNRVLGVDASYFFVVVVCFVEGFRCRLCYIFYLLASLLFPSGQVTVVNVERMLNGRDCRSPGVSNIEALLLWKTKF